jgi:hypothetical protein
MSTQQEQRKHLRLSITGRDYGIRFQINGLDLYDARLVNLSAGGCGLEVQMAEARHFEIGDVMESIYLDHMDLPHVPLTALVLRMLGKVPGKTGGYVLVGAEFQGMTPFVRNLIADHVTAQMTRE